MATKTPVKPPVDPIVDAEDAMLIGGPEPTDAARGEGKVGRQFTAAEEDEELEGEELGIFGEGIVEEVIEDDKNNG